MKAKLLNGMTIGLFLVMALLLGFAKPVVAAEPPAMVMDLPAGLACDFDLRIEIWGGGPQTYHEFADKDGNLVRTFSAGKGSKMTFTNLSTSTTMSTKPNGYVMNTTVNPDGSSTITALGHNVIILFPTDIPAGPSTTLYVGRIVFTIDPGGVYTMQEVHANTTDICAALSE